MQKLKIKMTNQNSKIIKKIIIANWKMNPPTLKEAERLFIQTQNYAQKVGNKTEVIIAPPFIYLPSLADLRRSKRGLTRINQDNIALAGQDCYWEQKGAYTGEVSPLMLKNSGCEYVIIGHSERRKYYGENDEMIAKKLKAALDAGLKPILCVGEILKQRKKRLQFKIVQKQLERALKDITNKISNFQFPISNKIPNSKFQIQNSLIIAYEPVWAIGTGIPCEPQEAVKMHQFIKKILNSKFYILNSPVLYGGSVDSQNIKSFFKEKEIDGALVGGASLKTEELIEIFKLF